VQAPAVPTWQQQAASWKHPQGLPDFPLIDHNGQDFTLHRYADDWLLVGFIFTRCPMQTACPLTMQRMRAVRRDNPDLALLTLTFDPAYDTPDRLRAYGTKHDADWTLATGPQLLMRDTLPAMFNVLTLPDGPANYTHTVKVSLLAPGLVLHTDFKDNAFTPADVQRELASRP